EVPATFPAAAPSIASAIPISATVPAIVVPSAIPEPHRMSPVIPGTYPDEDSIHEIVWAVIAVRRTGIRIIVVVPVGTSRRPSHVTWADPDSNSNPNLRLRVRKRHHQNRQQRDVFHITHTITSGFRSPLLCSHWPQKALQIFLVIGTAKRAKSFGNRGG